MNLNNQPTLSELQAIFTTTNDNEGNHILWVDKQGEVYLSLIPDHLSPNGFEDATPSMRLRYETFGQANGYVGPKAADDVVSMTRQHASLIVEWKRLPPNERVGYIDSW